MMSELAEIVTAVVGKDFWCGYLGVSGETEPKRFECRAPADVLLTVFCPYDHSYSIALCRVHHLQLMDVPPACSTCFHEDSKVIATMFDVVRWPTR